MNETKPTTQHVELPRQRGCPARAKDHYRKWWWAHSIAFIIIVLVVVLPVIYVAYPQIAQSQVNSSRLNITQMSITDPAPTSFLLNQAQVIYTTSDLHPTIFAFNASIALAGTTTPFTYIQVPQLKAKNGVTMSVAQTVQLSNSAGISDFASALMLNDEVSLNVYGIPGLKQGGLPKVPVTYNKTVTMKALSKFKGLSITGLQILSSVNPGEPNMKGTVYIPNQSVMTLQMGNLTFDLSSNNSRIGQAFLDDLTLIPGNNTLPITATIDQLKVLGILSENKTAADTGMLAVEIRGNKSEYNGQEIPYYTSALAANPFNIELNFGEVLASISANTTTSSS